MLSLALLTHLLLVGVGTALVRLMHPPVGVASRVQVQFDGAEWVVVIEYSAGVMEVIEAYPKHQHALACALRVASNKHIPLRS